VNSIVDNWLTNKEAFMNDTPHETFCIIEPFLKEHGIYFTKFSHFGDPMAWVNHPDWRSGDRLIKARGPVIVGPGSQEFDLHDERALPALVEFLEYYSK
jgi:hypothetical protein